MLPGLLLFLSGIAMAAPTPADCSGPEPSRLLQAATRTATEARGLWLDRRWLLWTGVKGEGRFRLAFVADPTLVAEPGSPLRGAVGTIALQAADTLPAPLAANAAWAGAGVALRLPDLPDARLQELLRGQLRLVREDAHGRVLDSSGVQLAGVLDGVYAAANDATLGVSVEPDATGFALWAPTARSVAVCVEHDGVSQLEPMRRDAATGIWLTHLSGNLSGGYYRYLVDVFVPGVGIVRNRVADPYSISLDVDSQRSYIANLDDPALKPDGWDAQPRPPALAAQTDMAVYELHVRDFSRDDASVPAAHRGKYLAFTDADGNGMRHLRALARAGITDAHLMPVFDFASVPEAHCETPTIPRAAADSEAQQAAVMAHAADDCFNWGYDPLHYGAPEGSYASDANDGAMRIREFRAMVQALHAAGLRVGMDVVYNHTHAARQDPHSVLDRIVPGYYQRLDANGKLETSTCCANTATEHAMMARLMIDTAVRWARDYGIDSFRFDLMGHQPRTAMEALQRRVDAAAGRHVNLIGEGWNFGEIANGVRFVQASQLSLAGSGIGSFSDRARDALRGGGCCDSGADLIAHQGLLNGRSYAPNALAQGSHDDLLRAADLARAGLAGTLRDVTMRFADGRVAPLSQLDYAGQPAGYAAAPGEVVNYVENHDNPTLWDVNALKLPQDTSPAERARVQLLGAAFVAFSQGVAYFHAGFDLLRSKSLDRNSFDSGDHFNRLDWSGADNGFGAGLPPKPDNGKDWELLKPLLRNANAKPSPRDIAWMRAAFRDLLRIRASTPLFHLRSADDVQRRLAFRNTGPTQNPMVIVGHLDGTGMVGPFRELLYLVNVSPEAQELVIPEEAGKRYALHPLQAAGDAVDDRPRLAKYRARDGRFIVPGRTAVVYVIPQE